MFNSSELRTIRNTVVLQVIEHEQTFFVNYLEVSKKLKDINQMPFYFSYCNI
jgi:hypothetical protein